MKTQEEVKREYQKKTKEKLRKNRIKLKENRIKLKEDRIKELRKNRVLISDFILTENNKIFKHLFKNYNINWLEEQEATKEKRKENMRKYQKQRRKTDPLFKISHNLRSRTSKAFKSKGYSKNTKTQEMLGVDWEVCKAHIERQFKKGMNWSNYGEWQIDHIIPLVSANNEKDLMKLCYYRNLQPLWAEDNLMKSAKILGQQSFMRL